MTSSEAAADCFEVIARKTDSEVKEQGGLDGDGCDVAPVNDGVEEVKLCRVLEGVHDEGDEAEDVEMRRFRRSPSPEEHVDAYAQIDEGDEAETLVDGAVRRFEDDLDVEARRVLEIARICR